MFIQWPKNQANMNVSHFKKFYQNIIESDTLLHYFLLRSNWGQSLCLSLSLILDIFLLGASLMVPGRIRQNPCCPVAASPPCPGACCPVRSQERGDCLCSATSQLPEGQGLFGACGTNIKLLCLLVTFSYMVRNHQGGIRKWDALVPSGFFVES